MRIFPAVDSWTKYSQYLDTVTGIPLSGTPSSSYALNCTHNLNQLLHNHFFPDVMHSPAKTLEKTSAATVASKSMAGDGGEFVQILFFVESLTILKLSS